MMRVIQVNESRSFNLPVVVVSRQLSVLLLFTTPQSEAVLKRHLPKEEVERAGAHQETQVES